MKNDRGRPLFLEQAAAPRLQAKRCRGGKEHVPKVYCNEITIAAVYVARFYEYACSRCGKVLDRSYAKPKESWR